MHRLCTRQVPSTAANGARVTALLEVDRFSGCVALATYTLSAAERVAFAGCLLCLQGGSGDDEGAWAPEPPDTDGLEERAARLRATLETLPERRRAAELEIATLSATAPAPAPAPADKRARAGAGAPRAPTPAQRFALHRAQMALKALDENDLRAKLAECEKALAKARGEAGWLVPLRAAVRLGRVGAHALLYDVARACTLCAPALPRAPVVLEGDAASEPAPHLCHTVCAFRYLLQGRAACTACRGVPGALRVGALASYVNDGGTRFIGTVSRCDWHMANERTIIELSVTSAGRFRLDKPLAMTLSAAFVQQLSEEREDDAHLVATTAETADEADTPTALAAPGGAPRSPRPPSLLAPPDKRHTIEVGSWVHGVCEIVTGDAAETAYIVGLVTRERVMTPLGHIGVSLILAQRDTAPGPSPGRFYLAALVSQRNYVARAIETPLHLTCAVSTRQLRPITALAARYELEQRAAIGELLNSDGAVHAPPVAPFRIARGAAVSKWTVLLPLPDGEEAAATAAAAAASADEAPSVPDRGELRAGVWRAPARAVAIALPNYVVETVARAFDDVPGGGALSSAERLALEFVHGGGVYAIEFYRTGPTEFTSMHQDVARVREVAMPRDGALAAKHVTLVIALNEDSIGTAIACPQTPFALSLYDLPRNARAPRPHAWRAALFSAGAKEAVHTLELRTDAQLATFRRGLGIEHARDGTLSTAGEAQVRAFCTALEPTSAPAARLELQASYADGAWRTAAAATLDGARTVREGADGARIFCVELRIEGAGDTSTAPVVARPYVAWCVSGGVPAQCWFELVPGRGGVAHALARSLADTPPAPLFLSTRFVLCALLSTVSVNTERGAWRDAARWPRLVRMHVTSSTGDAILLGLDEHDADIDGSVATLASRDIVGITLHVIDRSLWDDSGAPAGLRVRAARAAPAIACRLLAVDVGAVGTPGGARRYKLAHGAGAERDVGRGSCEGTTSVSCELRPCAGDARAWQLCALNVSIGMRALTPHLFALATKALARHTK